MDTNNRNKKKIFALSNGRYRGVELYETADRRIGFCLGILCYSAITLEQATTYIDGWYDLKKN